MKKFLLLLLVAAIVFVSCKKDNMAAVTADPASLSNATTISSGPVSFSDDPGDGGLAKIYLRKDGVYVLALEQMNYQSQFDKNIYLSATPQLTNTSIKISSAKKFNGNNYYPMSSGINLQAYPYLIIQGDTDAEAVAVALLK